MRLRLRLHLHHFASLAFGIGVMAAAPPANADLSTADGTNPNVTDPTAPFVAPAQNEVAGEIVVDARDDLAADAIASLAREYGLSLTANSAYSESHDKIEIAAVDPAREEEVLERLARDPRVEFAERQTLYWASFIPNDPLYESKQWHLKRVGAESAWEYSCGRGVTVAVLDTGVACYDKGPFSRGSDLGGTGCGGGYNFVHKNGDAYDDHGHGTHVAGTIAQTTNNGKGVAGLAYCANLMPIKVLSGQGWGTVANIAEGIRFAADNGAQVINMSLGGPIPSRIMRSAVDYAIKKGVTVVAAAGNSGREVGYPAAYPGVIAVSATDSNDTIAWFSSRGKQVAIAAPGVGVTQQTVCDGGKNKCELFGTFSGTSMASPHVAGAAALLISEGVSGDEAVRHVLTAAALAKGEPNLYGAGILDAAKSVARAHWMHTLLRYASLAVLFALVRRYIRKRGGEVVRSKLGLMAALVAATGLLPFLGTLHLLSRGGVAAELLARPFGEWDLLLSAGIHKWLPLANAIPVLAGTALFFGAKRLRPMVGGFALGMAAFLAQLAWSRDFVMPFGPVPLVLWCAANALVCLWIARHALQRAR